MSTKNKIDLKAVILELLLHKSKISFKDVAEASGLSKTDLADRKAISRMLATLTRLGHLEARGATRARTYIGQPIQARRPVGYNKSFLSDYKPNKTFYLSMAQRTQLMKIGRVADQVQPAGTYARSILNRLLIDLSWNSSRLEGNTYTILETKRLIELGESATGKDAVETQMILNHKGAIEYIVESVQRENIRSREVCSIHALLSENLLGDPSALGRVKQQECFALFIKKLNQIKDPYEQSFFSLVHLSYMQAFEDVNKKRTARLVANISLIKENLRPLSFVDVNQEVYVKSLLGIYEKNDVSLLLDLYLWAYERSVEKYSAFQQSMGEPNLLKMKYRNVIYEIICSLVLGKIPGLELVQRIRSLLLEKKVPDSDYHELFKQIETEFMSLHDGNIARFKISPRDFVEWKKRQ
jgi:hypothetical protein